MTMNIPPKDFIRVPHEPLRRFVHAAFEKVSLTSEDAALIAQLLVSNDLRGVWSHGTQQVPSYLNHFMRGGLNPRPDVKIVNESPTTLTIDGDGGLGYFAAYRSAIEIIPKAHAQGVGVATTRNHGHIGAAGLYSRIIVQSDLIAWVTSGHQTKFTPEGNLFEAAGGSPHSFAVPVDEDQPPIVLDFGAMHDLYSNSPHRMNIFDLAPGIVFRSIGLGVLCQTLGGLLCGIPADPNRASQTWKGANQGSFIVAVDPSRFMPLDAFKRETSEYVHRAGALKPLPGYERAELPGGPEWRREQESTRDGIPIGPGHQAALRKVADEFGLTPPF
ncbi:MAG: Ldh family oxidoreductase [Candidatus Latescibacteria bacterium]|nr:Ldh family oxidoreductase [Candidatus Latescibacterota bacterium]